MYIREDVSAQISFSSSNQSVECLMVKIKEMKSLYFVYTDLVRSRGPDS